MKKKLVSIIIVNWNGKRWLDQCLRSLKNQKYTHVELIFVDNASSDGSIQKVKEFFPKATIIVNSTNVGFAEGNNIGYKYARGAYVLFLNNDTRVTKTFLTELLEIFSHNPHVGGVQSKILLMDKPTYYDSIGAYLTPTGFLYHFGFGKRDTPLFHKPYLLYTAKGACMMFRKEVLEKVSVQGYIFDPLYFAYFEETDLCHRVWLAGYSIMYAYKSVIYHKMGATSTLIDNVFVQYHSFKNRIATYIKNFSLPELMVLLLIHLCVTELFATISLLRGKVSLWVAIQKAIFWNVIHMPVLLRNRRYVQKIIRKVKDSDIRMIIYKKPSLMYYWHWFRGNYHSL